MYAPPRNETNNHYHPYLEDIRRWGRIRGITKTRSDFDYAHPDFRFCDVHNRELDRMPQYTDNEAMSLACGCSRTGESQNEPIPPYYADQSIEDVRITYKEAEEALYKIQIEPRNSQSVLQHTEAVRLERTTWLAYEIRGHIMANEIRKKMKVLDKEIREPIDWDAPIPVSIELQTQLDAMSILIQDKRARSMVIPKYDPANTYCHTHKCLGDGYPWRHPSRYRECGICWNDQQLSEQELEKQRDVLDKNMSRAPSDLLNNNVKYS